MPMPMMRKKSFKAFLIGTHAYPFPHFSYTFLFIYKCSILRPCHTIAYRTSVFQRMKNIAHTPVYADIR